MSQCIEFELIFLLFVLFLISIFLVLWVCGIWLVTWLFCLPLFSGLSWLD
jgi:hypothetical protein